MTGKRWVIGSAAVALVALACSESTAPLNDTDPRPPADLNILRLAQSAPPAADYGALQAQLDANPADHQARFDLAMALYGNGEKDAAVDHLVEITDLICFERTLIIDCTGNRLIFHSYLLL